MATLSDLVAMILHALCPKGLFMSRFPCVGIHHLQSKYLLRRKFHILSLFTFKVRISLILSIYLYNSLPFSHALALSKFNF